MTRTIPSLLIAISPTREIFFFPTRTWTHSQPTAIDDCCFVLTSVCCSDWPALISRDEAEGAVAGDWRTSWEFTVFWLATWLRVCSGMYDVVPIAVAAGCVVVWLGITMPDCEAGGMNLTMLPGGSCCNPNCIRAVCIWTWFTPDETVLIVAAGRTVLGELTNTTDWVTATPIGGVTVTPFCCFSKFWLSVFRACTRDVVCGTMVATGDGDATGPTAAEITGAIDDTTVVVEPWLVECVPEVSICPFVFSILLIKLNNCEASVDIVVVLVLSDVLCTGGFPEAFGSRRTLLAALVTSKITWHLSHWERFPLSLPQDEHKMVWEAPF